MPYSIDVVCPLYKGFNFVKKLLENIYNQIDVDINNIVFPITDSEDEDFRKTIKYLEGQEKVKYFIVAKKDFSHSLTREKAIIEYCSSNIVVLITQDVNLFDNKAFYYLTKSIGEKKTAYNYGRQICKYKNIEKYIRQKNYPLKSSIVSSKDVDSMQLMAFFASDAFAALDREVFIKIGGYRKYDIMMSEDMLYSKFVLDEGYNKGYISEAVVEHSHKFTIKQLYKRYFDTGIFFAKTQIFNNYHSRNTGIRLAFYVLREAVKSFDIKTIFRWLPDMSARYIGMKKGFKNGN